MEKTQEQGPQVSPANPVDESLKEAQQRLAPRLEEAQAQLSALNERVKGFIKENPGTCLLGAAAVGFLLGRWASRR